MSIPREWKCTKSRPCPVCGKTSWCFQMPDGAVWCGPAITGGVVPAGWVVLEGKDGGRALRRDGDRRDVDHRVLADNEDTRRGHDAVKSEHARRLWTQARAEAEDDIAKAYLTRRGVAVHAIPAFSADAQPGLPPTVVGVRSWRDEWYDEENGRWVALEDDTGRSAWPAVVAAFVDAGGEVVCTQQIFLDADDPSRKREARTRGGSVMPAKRQLGVMRGGGAVRLGIDFSGGRLIICEGLETGLAIAHVVKEPVWCCLSTSGLHRPGLTDGLVAPKGRIRRVAFAVDYDHVNEQLGARPGEHAARHAAMTLARDFEEIAIELAIPSHEICPDLIDAQGELVA